MIGGLNCFYNSVYYKCNNQEFDMSFNFQGPGDRPIIQGAQNMMNNGGGGNLGYFQGRQKKKEEKKTTLFEDDDEDSFTPSSGEKILEPPQNPEEGGAMNALKGFWNKITQPKKENN